MSFHLFICSKFLFPSFLWTEVEFMVNLQEGVTLRIYLTSEKEQIREYIFNK